MIASPSPAPRQMMGRSGVPLLVAVNVAGYAPLCTRMRSPGRATLSASASPRKGLSSVPRPSLSPGTTWSTRRGLGASGSPRVRAASVREPFPPSGSVRVRRSSYSVSGCRSKMLPAKRVVPAGGFFLSAAVSVRKRGKPLCQVSSPDFRYSTPIRAFPFASPAMSHWTLRQRIVGGSSVTSPGRHASSAPKTSPTNTTHMTTTVSQAVRIAGLLLPVSEPFPVRPSADTLPSWHGPIQKEIPENRRPTPPSLHSLRGCPWAWNALGPCRTTILLYS